MKKFIVGIMAVLFSAPSFAQFTSGGFSLDENSVYYGVRIGINFARLGGDLYDDLGTKVGIILVVSLVCASASQLLYSWKVVFTTQSVVVRMVRTRPA